MERALSCTPNARGLPVRGMASSERGETEEGRGREREGEREGEREREGGRERAWRRCTALRISETCCAGAGSAASVYSSAATVASGSAIRGCTSPTRRWACSARQAIALRSSLPARASRGKTRATGRAMTLHCTRPVLDSMWTCKWGCNDGYTLHAMDCLQWIEYFCMVVDFRLFAFWDRSLF